MPQSNELIPVSEILSKFEEMRTLLNFC